MSIDHQGLNRFQAQIGWSWTKYETRHLVVKESDETRVAWMKPVVSSVVSALGFQHKETITYLED